jgi:hypothetical protein
MNIAVKKVKEKDCRENIQYNV